MHGCPRIVYDQTGIHLSPSAYRYMFSFNLLWFSATEKKIRSKHAMSITPTTGIVMLVYKQVCMFHYAVVRKC